MTTVDKCLQTSTRNFKRDIKPVNRTRKSQNKELTHSIHSNFPCSKLTKIIESCAVNRTQNPQSAEPTISPRNKEWLILK